MGPIGKGSRAFLAEVQLDAAGSLAPGDAPRSGGTRLISLLIVTFPADTTRREGRPGTRHEDLGDRGLCGRRCFPTRTPSSRPSAPGGAPRQRAGNPHHVRGSRRGGVGSGPSPSSKPQLARHQSIKRAYDTVSGMPHQLRTPGGADMSDCLFDEIDSLSLVHGPRAPLLPEDHTVQR
jgi:hypothetical protein